MMRRKRLIAGLVALIAGLTAQGPANAAQLAYSLYVLGLPVAEALMTVDIGPVSYSLGLRYRTTGLGALVSGDHLEEQTSGLFDRAGLVPREYFSTIRLHGQDRLMRLDYHGGTPAIAQIAPPNETEREIVPAPLLAQTIDPLSATIAMLHQAAQNGRCDLTHRTYDGRRLEAFVSRTGNEEDVPASIHSNYSGPGLRCDYSSQVLAGFRTDSGRDEDARARRGTLWLAPLIPGYPRLPIRGVVDTRFLGQATMYLTAVKP